MVIFGTVFDLDRLDNFVQNLGVEYSHYKSMPSPIGQGDRGDYRRNDGVDTITSTECYILSLAILSPP